MPISRIYQNTPLATNSTIELDTQASHHIARVLRANIHDSLVIFNGTGGEYLGVITHILTLHERPNRL
jgi:16S rRNA (uracil1498-N3)-methyltransferase